ncbi:MAG TPA: HAD-IB family phosphatase [Gemmatimonadaceae bacterium]|nr:HAD-IB family phosphatase [Gemmatimonadaceae bacterium]
MVLDVDSTLTSIEGISWLAERRGPDVARAVDAMTVRAMEGATPLEAVYGERLALVRPSRVDLRALAGAYAAALVPDVQSALDVLRAAHVRLVVVSGGLRDAVVPFVATLGIAERDVHAVALRFAPDGTYAGFDASSPLACRLGKPAIARTLALPRPVLAVGDGSTDAELKECVDAFAAFTGVVRRESVVAAADHVISRFVDLPSLVL